jgi:hypothetical protein
MMIYENKNGYSVYVENDGNDVWVSVRHGGNKLYDCIVGNIDDCGSNNLYLETAYHNFFPANYVKEHIKANDTRERTVSLANEAFYIDHALEMAMSI